MRSFWDILDWALNNPALKEHRITTSFEPSSAGITVEPEPGLKIRYGGCPRKAFYSHRGYPKDGGLDTWDGHYKRKGGDFVTNEMTAILMRAWALIGNEIRVNVVRSTKKKRLYRMSGRIDLCVRNPDTGGPIFIECKLRSEYGKTGIIESRKENDYLCHMPLTAGLAEIPQSVIYYDFIRSEMGVPNPDYRIVYQSRETATRSEHWLSIDPDGQVVISNIEGVQRPEGVTLQRIYEDADDVMDAVFDDCVPDRPFSLQWSEQRLRYEHRRKGLRNKALFEAVKAWIVKGGTPPPIGDDFPCTFCDYFRGCHEGYPGFAPQRAPAPTIAFIPQEEGDAPIPVDDGPSMV